MIRQVLPLFSIVCFLSISCSLNQTPKDLNSFATSGSPVKYLLPKTVTVKDIDYKQVQYPIGKFGNSLTLSIFGSGPKTFNPWVSTDATSSELGLKMFDGLFETNPVTGEIIPHFAKSYDILDNGKTVVVKLRDGIKWSDGVEITSDDVVFTWNDIVFSGLEGGGFQSLVLIDGKYPTVKKIDNKTVEFMTHVVFAPFLRQIGYPIAPKHVIEPILKNTKENAKEEFLRLWSTDVNPDDLVVSGPFKLSRYIEGERVEFVKNKDYFVVNKNNERLPYFDRLIYTIVQDKSFELFKFLAGELDYISVRGEDVETLRASLEKKKNYSIVNLGPSSGTEFLVFNLHRDAWFNNIYFRKAVSHAIDREGIVDNVLAGIGAPLFTPEPLPSIFLNKKLSKGYSQNLQLSRGLLKKGGFRWDKSGQLLDQTSKQVEFTILTNAENTNRQATGVIIQDDLSKLGVKVNLRPLDFNTLIGRSDTGDWEAIILGFTGGFFEPNDGANVWRLDGRLHMFDNKPHKPRDWEIRIDKVFNEATKVVSFNERKKLYDIFQEVVYDKLPFIYLTSPLHIVAYQNSLDNVVPTVYGGILHNIESIYKQ